MTRVRVLLGTIAPSMILGGFLFGSSAGHADAGRDGALGQWPAVSDAAAPRDQVAQADPWSHTRPRGGGGYAVPPVPPMPPMPPSPMVPPVPPLPPRPPMPPAPHGRHHGRGVSVSFHDGRLELEGVQELVQDQLDRVTEVLDTVQDLPPDVRERVRERVRSVRDKLRTRLGKLRSIDLDQLGTEMERMGDEIEKEMEGLDKDLSQFGDKFGEKFGQQFGKTFEKFGKDFAKSFNVGPGAPRVNVGRDSDRSDDADDSDDDDEDRAVVAVQPGGDLDPDLRAAIGDLKGLTLDAGQKQRLAQLRAEADRQISDAQQELDAMSGRLHDALGDLGASEADIARQIDRISAKEATIRKARILTWVRARSLLSDDQRRRVEAAARRGH